MPGRSRLECGRNEDFHLKFCASFIALSLLFALFPSEVAAQARPRRRLFDLGIGGLWMVGSNAGGGTATETRNQTGSTDRLTLFELNARMRSAPGIDSHLAFSVTPNVALEGSVIYSRPSLSTSIANDFEGAPNVTLSNSTLQEVLATGGVVVHFPRWHVGGRLLPFVTASAGYLRQVTEDRMSVETGRIYKAGWGVKQMLSPAGRVGLRFDAALGLRDGGLAFETGRLRPFFIAGGGTYVVF